MVLPRSHSLAQRTITAAQWRFASQAVQGGLSFGVGVLLARLLSPREFGVVALAGVVVGLAELFSKLGLGSAVVQRRPLTSRHVRVAFTTSVLLGIGVAGALALLAAPAAVLMRNPQVAPIIRAEALLFVLTGFGTIAHALLDRALDFRRLFTIELVSYVAGYALVAVTMALRGFGAWSLVCGALTQQLLANAIAFGVVRHAALPLLARREMRELLGFGAGVSLTWVVNYAARNGDNFLVGRWLGAVPLGIYARAYNLMALPHSYFSGVLGRVLFPALSEIRTQPARFRRAYLMSVQLTALVAAPVMAGMIVAAPHLILGLYGPRWAGVVAPLSVLCGAGLFRAIYHLGGILAQASGNVYAELRRQVAYALLVLGLGAAGLRYGVTGVAVGVSLAVFFMYVAMGQLSVRITGCGWRPFLMAQAPGVLLAVVVAGTTLAVRIILERRGMPSGAILPLLVATAGVVYPLGWSLLPDALRPAELCTRLGAPAARLPAPLRHVVGRVLRIPA